MFAPFVSDDELKEEILFKNLYRANNLEQFRCQTNNGQDQREMYPKLIITARSELLSRDKSYITSFVPLESDSDTKGTPEKASEYFKEMRIAPFDDKVVPYIHALVALELRQTFEARVGASLEPLPALPAKVESEFSRRNKIPGLAAMEESLSAPGHAQAEVARDHRANAVEKVRSLTLTDDSLSTHVALLACACTNEVSPDQIASFTRYAESSGEAIWRFTQYFEAFDGIPGVW